jgi:3-methyladenine DNA glycosylase AlkC
MPEPFKYFISDDFVTRLAESLASTKPDFLLPDFKNDVLNADWEHRELKNRISHVSEMLNKHLLGNFEQQVDVLESVCGAFSGLPALVFPEFVAQIGLQNVQRSLAALKRFTIQCSSEFGIRPFLLHFPRETFLEMERWAENENVHIRRLASEGCRPRLPWGMGLPAVKKNPAPVWRILEKLKTDPELYVRKSVANNINDISKDHPESVLKWCESNFGNNPHTNWIIQHGLRTLLKTGNERALTLFSVHSSHQIRVVAFNISPKEIAIDDSVQINVELESLEEKEVAFRLEFAITFVNRSGKGGRKVFQWKKGTIQSGQKCSFIKNVRFQNATIRTIFPGIHNIEAILNGKTVAEMELLVK